MSSSAYGKSCLPGQQIAAPYPVAAPGNSGDGCAADHLHKPSSALKREGWNGFMHGVDERGILIVTPLNQPEVAMSSVERY